MKKQMLVWIVGSTVMTPMAGMANDFEVFGRLYVEIGQVEEGDDAESRGYTGDENGMGRIGVRGSHRIDENLTLVGTAAWNLNVGDSDANLTDRDHNIGLQGRWGTVRVGSFDGAYKATGGAKFDAFASTALQARGNGGMATGPFGTTSYFHNAMQYESPNINGLNAVVQYSIDERDRSNDIDNYKGAYNLGVTYDFLDNYQVIGATNSVNTLEDGRKGNSKAGMRARFGDFTGFIQYEDVSLMGTQVRDHDILFLGARYRIGKTMLVAQYGDLDDNDGNNRDQTYYALGGRYFFDRRTSAYVGYKNSSFDEPDQKDLSTVMVSFRYDFSISP